MDTGRVQKNGGNLISEEMDRAAPNCRSPTALQTNNQPCPSRSAMVPTRLCRHVGLLSTRSSAQANALAGEGTGRPPKMASIKTNPLASNPTGLSRHLSRTSLRYAENKQESLSTTQPSNGVSQSRRGQSPHGPQSGAKVVLSKENGCKGKTNGLASDRGEGLEEEPTMEKPPKAGKRESRARATRFGG